MSLMGLSDSAYCTLTSSWETAVGSRSADLRLPKTSEDENGLKTPTLESTQ